MRIPTGLEERFKDDVDWAAVLVVDDDAELNDLLKRWFERKLSRLRGPSGLRRFRGRPAHRRKAPRLRRSRHRPAWSQRPRPLPQDKGGPRLRQALYHRHDRPRPARRDVRPSSPKAPTPFSPSLWTSTPWRRTGRRVRRQGEGPGCPVKVLCSSSRTRIRFALRLRDYLVKKGYDVLVASDGVGAIKLLLDYRRGSHRVGLSHGRSSEGTTGFKLPPRTYCPANNRIIITSGFLHARFRYSLRRRLQTFRLQGPRGAHCRPHGGAPGGRPGAEAAFRLRSREASREWAFAIPPAARRSAPCLRGWVRNLPDGYVELMAEGERPPWPISAYGWTRAPRGPGFAGRGRARAPTGFYSIFPSNSGFSLARIGSVFAFFCLPCVILYCR